jgi:hypothetical protein
MSSLLMSPAAQKIDFYLDSFHVDGSGLSFVALALASKPHGSHGVTVRLGHVPPDADAAYDPAINTFDFPNANYGATDAWQKSAIIHECVHALRDAQGRKLRTSRGTMTTLALSDEAAAYVAGALFNIFDTTPAGSTPSTPTWAVNDPKLLGLAHSIAVTMSTQNGYAVDPRDAKRLRDAIMNDPTYKDLKKAPKTSYENNGVAL